MAPEEVRKMAERLSKDRRVGRFVRDIPQGANENAIARAILTLGHGLNLKVIAEGVETEAQASFLRDYRCDEVQGYLFGRPMPPAQLGDFLQQNALIPTRG